MAEKTCGNCQHCGMRRVRCRAPLPEWVVLILSNSHSKAEVREASCSCRVHHPTDCAAWTPMEAKP